MVVGSGAVCDVPLRPSWTVCLGQRWQRGHVRERWRKGGMEEGRGKKERKRERIGAGETCTRRSVHLLSIPQLNRDFIKCQSGSCSRAGAKRCGGRNEPLRAGLDRGGGRERE